MRNAMEKELKTERTRDNRKDFALTLMPLYAISVGVFALYKFLKVNIKKNQIWTARWKYFVISTYINISYFAQHMVSHRNSSILILVNVEVKVKISWHI